MPLGEALSDDYVAELLKRDAKATSARASSLLNRRPAGSAPKPNTRFLRNILRDTDSHNAALLAKEADESQARLRRLRDEQQKRFKPEQSLYSARARHEDGARESAKRRRVEDDDAGADARRKTRHRDHDRLVVRDKRHENDRPARRTRPEETDTKGSRRDRSDRQGRRSDEEDAVRSRHKPLRVEDRHREHRKERHRRRSRSPYRSPSPERSRRSDRHDRHDKTRRTPSSSSTSSHHKTSRSSKPHTSSRASHRPSPAPSSESDPLEAIIGPPPPPREAIPQSRGRGAFADRSAIDCHFSSNYDPAVDVQPDVDEADDWDQALEALRDRQKWKQQGADRLRAAGFTDDEVRKWEKGGEKAADDVRWSEKGEGREWDRGKVVGDDGIVDVRAEWVGRLKGT